MQLSRNPVLVSGHWSYVNWKSWLVTDTGLERMGLGRMEYGVWDEWDMFGQDGNMGFLMMGISINLILSNMGLWRMVGEGHALRDRYG
jgi:hypothetical protein